MQKILSLIGLLAIGQATIAQSIDKIINATEVERIERTLAADDMEGRRTFTKGIDKAADFIAAEFKKAGIQPLKGDSYFQDFAMLKGKFLNAKAAINGKNIEEKNIVALTAATNLKADQNAGYEKVRIESRQEFYSTITRLLDTDKNYLLTVNDTLGRMFNSLKRFRESFFESRGNIIAVLTNENPETYSVEFNQEISRAPLKNVVGMIPGKKKKDEYVIFSGHYDHLGIAKPNEAGDSIFNGANDDASGVTAVIMLANYYAQLKNNERTIIFAAFTAEEVGGFGSTYFSKQFDPSKVMAMFNIEMIGTDSKWGNNSAFITGYEKTDMGKILEKNLKGSAFKFYPDPYPDQQLFYRSDNATLARQGVPAHTISTSKMDSEKFYHTLDDEIETLDMKNMTEIIKSIAVSAKTIIAGKDTPSRVDTKDLR